MKVWIVQIGEPLPIDKGNPRLFRSGLLARRLVQRGHEVLWWASTFDGLTKRHRYRRDTQIPVEEKLTLLLLHSPGYFSNVSLSRLRDHRVLGKRFRVLAEEQCQPDIIHCGFPTIDLSLEAVRYGNRHGVPVVLDTRDFWPDIFVDAVPRIFRPLARRAIPWERARAREAFQRATAVTGHTPGFVEFGLRYAGRPATSLDRAFPFGYPMDRPSDQDTDEAHAFWKRLGINGTDPNFTICFLGNFGVARALDLTTPIRAARLLEERGVSVRFVLCGTGPRLEEYRREAAQLQNVLFPGWIGYPRMWTLMRLSHIGLLPYLPTKDCALTVPNKVAEYLSGSLPVLTSLTGGYLEGLLRANDCGFFYRGGDVTGLANTIETLLKIPDRLKTMKDRAQNWFKKEFAEDKVYEGMADYLEIVAKTRSTNSQV